MVENDKIVSNRCPQCNGHMDLIENKGVYRFVCSHCGYEGYLEKTIPSQPTIHEERIITNIPKPSQNSSSSSGEQKNYIPIIIVVVILLIFSSCLSSGSNNSSSSASTQSTQSENGPVYKIPYVTADSDLELLDWDAAKPQMQDIFTTNAYKNNYSELYYDNPVCERAVLLVSKGISKSTEFENRLLLIYSQHYVKSDFHVNDRIIFKFDGLKIEDNQIHLNFYNYEIKTYGGNVIGSAGYDESDIDPYINSNEVSRYAENYKIYELDKTRFNVY